MTIKSIFRFFLCLPKEEEKDPPQNSPEAIKKIDYLNISFDKPVTMSAEEYEKLNIQILKQKNNAIEGTSPEYKNDSIFKAAKIGDNWLVKRCAIQKTSD